MKLALIGDPVAHSRSPAIFAELFAAHAVDGSYDAVRVLRGEAAAGILELMAQGYTGLNVTTPLKEEAFAVADSADATAQFVRAANILTLTRGRIACGNTDGIGGRMALEAELGAPLEQTEVLILGAGPTGRAIAYELSAAGADVLLWNRTRARAEALAGALEARVWNARHPVAAVFSTLPPEVDLDPDVAAALRAAAIVIDANYGSRATLGARLGRTVSDGLAMLRAQAEVNFEIWRGAHV